MMPAFQRHISAASSFKEILASAGLALSLLAPSHVEAQYAFEPSLVKMLPVYCKYTQQFREVVPGGNNPAEIQHWTSAMGATFNHMHHYCYGLMDSNRAKYLSKTPLDRMHNLNNSVTEFDYVIQRAPPDFRLMPEILTNKGESLIRVGKGPQALLELQRAIALKPDYWPPYAAISDYFKEFGDLAKAREWLEKGLLPTKNAKPLARRLAELDGPTAKQKPVPEPAEKASPPK